MINPTADDIKHELKDVRYRTGKGAWDSADAMTADVSAELRRRGIPHSPAQYDAGGNCLTCGECGRCPGVHTFEEIQRADRAQKGIACKHNNMIPYCRADHAWRCADCGYIYGNSTKGNTP